MVSRSSSRTFDVLLALIEARGAGLSKGALMARVWPDRIVEHRPKRSRLILKYRLPNLSDNRCFAANSLSRYRCDCGQALRGISLYLMR